MRILLVLFSFVQIVCFSLCARAENWNRPSEKDILKTFIAIYERSRTPYELRRRLLTFKEVDANQAAYLFGADYFKPLPKLSYDLEKMEVRIGDVSVTFTNLVEGEAKINGKPYKYDRNSSFTRNYVNLLNAYVHKAKKRSAVESVFLIGRAHAGEAFPTYEEIFVINEMPGLPDKMTSRGPNRIMMTTAGVNGVDTDLYDPLERVASRKGVATAATGAGIMIGAAPLIAVLPLHYAVVNAHAYIVAPSCETQAVEIAETLNKDEISMSSLNCANYFNFGEHSSIGFWQKDGRYLELFANWDKQEAWIHPHQLLKFDREKLTEVREMRYSDPAPGSSSQRLGVLAAERVNLVAGDPQFESIKRSVEPMRKVLEIFGRNESCTKCEKYFKESLVRSESGRYDVKALRQKAGLVDPATSSSKQKSK